MIYTVTTTENIETIKKEIGDKAKEFGFNLLNSYEFNRIMEDHGTPIPKEITVFELCNPHGAQQALSELPEISVYLPPKISLYENNGFTRMSTIDLSILMNASEVDERFKAFTLILFANLKRIMHSWDHKTSLMNLLTNKKPANSLH